MILYGCRHWDKTQKILHISFCKAVQLENESDIKSAYNNVVQHLEYFSNGHSVDYGVRAISAKDNIIQYFFNGENAVPDIYVIG